MVRKIKLIIHINWFDFTWKFFDFRQKSRKVDFRKKEAFKNFLLILFCICFVLSLCLDFYYNKNIKNTLQTFEQINNKRNILLSLLYLSVPITKEIENNELVNAVFNAVENEQPMVKTYYIKKPKFNCSIVIFIK